eukprot:14046682-Alexandrium_andersonii.AAC.1
MPLPPMLARIRPNQRPRATCPPMPCTCRQQHLPGRCMGRAVACGLRRADVLSAAKEGSLGQ